MQMGLILKINWRTYEILLVLSKKKLDPSIISLGLNLYRRSRIRCINLRVILKRKSRLWPLSRRKINPNESDHPINTGFYKFYIYQDLSFHFIILILIFTMSDSPNKTLVEIENEIDRRVIMESPMKYDLDYYLRKIART